MINQKMFNEFWRFVHARHEVFINRFIKQSPPPWSEDHILQQYKFTNVFREIDRESLYLINSILCYEPSSHIDKVFNVLLYRLFNKLDTHRAIGFQFVDTWNPERVRAKILLNVEKPFTDAFLTVGLSKAGGKYYNGDKLGRVLYGLIDHEIYNRIDQIDHDIQSVTSMEGVFHTIDAIYGYGPFLAYEATIDLNYPPLTRFSENDFVSCGPGCQRGIDLIYPDKGILRYEDIVIALQSKQEDAFRDLGLKFNYFCGRSLTLRNIEHSLCEFQKYWRLRTGGRPTRKFIPRKTVLPDPEYLDWLNTLQRLYSKQDHKEIVV